MTTAGYIILAGLLVIAIFGVIIAYKENRQEALSKKIIISLQNFLNLTLMNIRKITLFLLMLFATTLILESCASNNPQCGTKRQKKAQHARTKKMTGTGWVQ